MENQETQYRAIFPNQAYAKDEVFPIKGTEKTIGIRRLILPRRYTEPSEYEVIKKIQATANNVEAAASIIVIGGNNFQNRSPLEQALMGLPDDVRADIRMGDEACIEFLKTHTPAQPIKGDEQPKKYVHVSYGIMPIEAVKANELKGNIKDAQWYEEAFSNKDVRRSGFGIKWSMKLLLPNEALPEKADLDTMLRNGVYGSRTFEISQSNYSIDEAKEAVDLLYTAFSTTQKISQLTDVSDDVLEQHSIQPLLALHQNIALARASRRQQEQPTINIG